MAQKKKPSIRQTAKRMKDAETAACNELVQYVAQAEVELTTIAGRFRDLRTGFESRSSKLTKFLTENISRK